MRVLAILVMIVAVVASGGVVGAHEATPDTIRASRFPSSTDIGQDWVPGSRFEYSAFDTSVFERIDGIRYQGPRGAQILIIRYETQPGRVAIQRSWEIASEDLESLQFAYQIFDPPLNRTPRPSGCIDAVRVQGRDPIFNSLVGFTLCAADPNLIVLTATSGLILGRGGIGASDYVTSMVVPGSS